MKWIEVNKKMKFEWKPYKNIMELNENSKQEAI